MKIGVIGGSGLDDPQLLENYREKKIKTPYGNPSSALTLGTLEGVEVVIIARHGKKHEIYPSKINYRANIYALKQEGCTHIISTNAVGSLKEHIKPGDLVFPDQFIDFTRFRKNTYFDKYGEVKHQPMAEPFSNELRELLADGCRIFNFPHHTKAAIIVIEGPRFSTKAESFMFKNFADIIGMTTFPEVALANELNIPYASIAMSTDYDCWKDDEPPVSFEIVMQRMKENAEKVKKLLMYVIPIIIKKDEEYIKSKIRTIPNFPKPGIMFRDITTLLLDPDGMRKTINILYNRYKDKKITAVAGIESRGFIIAGILADKLGVGLIPIRKKGKLPYQTVSQSYELEYGTDHIEIHADAIKQGDNILLVDDLIATGGSSQAAAQLIEKLGGKVEEISFIIELTDLRGREKLKKWPVYSMIKFEGE
ncbi:S-methyl-5'-thioadenosine phosphorylase [Candidatus Pacearchaeota archaeon]|nr:S-methyl-5'-thioadenosine phosphorylase [Candidatus Pacearchaeota archaeon]